MTAAIEAEGASGYEAFLSDTAKESSTIQITSFFEPNSAEKDAAAAVSKGSEQVPQLTASSDSENSSPSTSSPSAVVEEAACPKEEAPKEGSESWMSACQMDTMCGKLDIEFMKQEAAPPKDNAVTEQSELPAIEGSPAPKPWTESLTESTQEAQTTVSKKTRKLLLALGLAKKKDQALLTDFYTAKPVPEEPEKSISEKIQEAQASARDLYVSASSKLQSLAQKAEETKEPTQKLMTDYDPNKSEVMAAELTEEEIPACDTIATEADPATVGPEVEELDTEKKKRSWIKSFMSKFKLPKKTPTCDLPEVPSCPAMQLPEVPSCPAMPKAEMPRGEMPAFTLGVFSKP